MTDDEIVAFIMWIKHRWKSYADDRSIDRSIDCASSDDFISYVRWALGRWHE
jgi:hypothetical protein